MRDLINALRLALAEFRRIRMLQKRRRAIKDTFLEGP